MLAHTQPLKMHQHDHLTTLQFLASAPGKRISAVTQNLHFSPDFWWPVFFANSVYGSKISH